MRLQFQEFFLGKQLSEIFASYYYDEDSGEISAPLSICVRGQKGGLIGITSDGKGRLKEIDPLSTLYIEQKLGFVFVAPLGLRVSNYSFDPALIINVDHSVQKWAETVRLITDGGFEILVQSEDDELFVAVKSLDAT